MSGVISTKTVLLGMITSSVFVQDEKNMPADSIAKMREIVFIKRVLLNQCTVEFKKRAPISPEDQLNGLANVQADEQPVFTGPENKL